MQLKTRKFYQKHEDIDYDKVRVVVSVEIKDFGWGANKDFRKYVQISEVENLNHTEKMVNTLDIKCIPYGTRKYKTDFGYLNINGSGLFLLRDLDEVKILRSFLEREIQADVEEQIRNCNSWLKQFNDKPFEEVVK